MIMKRVVFEVPVEGGGLPGRVFRSHAEIRVISHGNLVKKNPYMPCDCWIVFHRLRKAFETIHVWNQFHAVEQDWLGHHGECFVRKADVLDISEAFEMTHYRLKDLVGELRHFAKVSTESKLT